MNDITQALARATQLGLTIGLTTVFTSLGGLLLGLWVDGKLGTRPWATLLLTVVGVLAGSVSTYRLALSIVERAPLVPEGEQPPILGPGDVRGTLWLAARIWFTLAGSILLSLLLGWWIDGCLGTRPCLTVILTFVGLGAGSVGVYSLTRGKGEKEGV